MNASLSEFPGSGRRLPSIFDALPPDVAVSLDTLELLIHLDTERRSIAVLDRVFGSRPEPPLPEPIEPS
jgi:hypothetical protein